MIRIVQMLVILACFLTTQRYVSADDREPEGLPHTEDSLEKVKEMVKEKKAVLVDVRSIPEWDKGHVKEAIFLPWRDLQDKLKEKDVKEKIPEDRVVYTYCAVGYRASRAGKIIAGYGFDVRPLKPGYEELVKAGFQSEKKE
jgi:rhodanese-related sulfurtransferase